MTQYTYYTVNGKKKKVLTGSKTDAYYSNIRNLKSTGTTGSLTQYQKNLMKRNAKTTRPTTAISKGTSPIGGLVKKAVTGGSNILSNLFEQIKKQQATTSTTPKLKTATDYSTTPTTYKSGITAENEQDIRFSLDRKMAQGQLTGKTPEFSDLEIDYLGALRSGTLPSKANQTVTNPMDAYVKELEKQYEELKRQTESRKNKIAQSQAGRIQQMRSDVSARYEPQFQAQERQGELARLDLGRTMASRGIGRSGYSSQQFETTNAQIRAERSALEAQKNAEIALREAQIRGADDEKLASLSSRLQEVEGVYKQQQLASAVMKQELEQKASAESDVALLEFAKTLEVQKNEENAQEFDKNATEGINDGFAYDKFGRRLKDVNGNDLSVGATKEFNYTYKGNTTDASGNPFAIYLDKNTGKSYLEPMAVGGNVNSSITPVNVATQFSLGTGRRTDRHNNPTAMITAVAKQGGLIEGQDYVQGDSFVGGDGRTYYTATLLGDAYEKTRKVIDNIGFTTQAGGKRWTYTDINNDQWRSMDQNQKNQYIEKMYNNHEKGDGGLLLNNYYQAGGIQDKITQRIGQQGQAVSQPMMQPSQPQYTAPSTSGFTSKLDMVGLQEQAQRAATAMPGPEDIRKFDSEQIEKKDSIYNSIVNTNSISQRMNDLINFYDTNKDNLDPSPITNAQKKNFNSKINSLIVELNKVYGLGALSGPDFDILESQVVNPASGWFSALSDAEREKAFKNSIYGILNNFYNEAVNKYQGFANINRNYSSGSQTFNQITRNLNSFADVLDSLEANIGKIK